MLFFILLLAFVVTIRAEGYGAPPPASIAPASAPYGAPYSSNQVVAVPQVVQQQFQPMPQQLVQHSGSAGVGVQQVGMPVSYSMYSNTPQQMNQNPYQLYERHAMPNQVFLNYPQGMIIQPQRQQNAVLPTAGTTFIASSGYGQPATMSTQTTGPYATQTTSSETSTEEKGTTLSAMSGSPGVVDPWASLGGLPAKKIESRKKKNSDGL
nr:unnamed protein product [Haemonchus contortus]